MSTQSIEKRCVLLCKGVPTRDWYAWNNLMLPKPDDFHVIGEVQVSNPGVLAMLYPKEPQGINPDILLLDLILVQQPGIWPQVVTWVTARYDKILFNSTFKNVEIFCEDKKIVDITVRDIH
ncbi:hypothetical protein [Acaryochloris sp. IP29b_bin.148]|uniref:hypothetical protein n=1 Tax=Acaryochloris sp. IP29b_bin.148 TaxID=2969218 RepID=UPI0026067D5E|nr:hypothetical protein [Acaryochloris sp. IP29b_bin.148]